MRINGLTGNFQGIIGTDLPNSLFHFQVLSSGAIQMGVYSTVGSFNVISNYSMANAIGEWVHVVATYSGSSLSLYINGTLDNSVSTSLGALNPIASDNFFIGRTFTQASSRYFDGNMDELFIYNRVLSDNEIRQLYQSQTLNFIELSPSWTPHWDQIVGYWKMDGNWQDSSGNDNHGVGFGDTTFDLDAKVGGISSSFDGSGDHIQSTVNLGATQTVRMAAWIKNPNPIPVGRVGIFYKLGPQLEFNITPSGNLQTYISNDSAWHAAALSPIFSDWNRWHHVAVTYDGSRVIMYRNGEVVATSGAETGDLAGADNRFWMNYQSSQGATGEGLIDDAALWNGTALSHADISLIYHRQKQKYAGSYESEIMSAGATSPDWPDMSWSTSVPFGKELVGDFDNDGWSDSEKSDDYPLMSQSLSEGLTSYWPLNETGPGLVFGDDIEDKSASDRHGLAFGAPTFNQVGRLHKSLYFDGTDDFFTTVASSEFVEGDSSFTISCWINTTTPSNTTDNNVGSRCLTLHRADLPSNSSKIGMGLYGNNTDSVMLFTNGAGLIVQSSAGVLDGQWHHLLASYNHETDLLSLFIDGKFAQSTTGVLSSAGSQLLHIGTYRSIDGFFEGYIDEVAIWNRALSPTEIQQLYQRGSNRLKLQIKSCIDPSCNCRSYNTSPAGSATDCDGDGLANSLDGEDIYKSQFMGPGGNGATYYSEAFNRLRQDLAFQCGDNNSDDESSICVNDEISMSASPQPTRPLINYGYFPLSARPAANPYFQYRAYLEADSNSACNGSPCFPGLTSVDLSPNIKKYDSQTQEVQPKDSISYKAIQSAQITSDDCARFQLSPDGSQFYFWDSNTWNLATLPSERSTKEHIENYITQFSEQFGPGKLYIKSFLQTNAQQNSNCSIQSIDIKYSRN